MKEYLQIFKQIDQNIQNSNSLSPEIQSAAVNLQENLTPCIQVIKQATKQLNSLIKPCLSDLEEAENIWQSKSKICSLSNTEIIEEIGVIRGKIFRVNNQVEKYINYIQNRILSKLAHIFSDLKNKYFSWDESKQKFNKNSLNIFEKDNLIKSLESEFYQLGDVLKLLIQEALNLIFNEIKIVNSTTYEKCLQALDSKNRKIFTQSMDLSDDFQYLSSQLLDNYSLFMKINNPIQELIKNSILGISLDNFNKTYSSLEEVVKNNLKEVIENGKNKAIETLEKFVNFYNKFLEKQSHYQQETPEQRKKEKKWIDDQFDHIYILKGKISQINS